MTAPAAAARTALRTGAQRGWTETLLSLRSPQDQGFYAVVGIVAMTYLWFSRDDEVSGGGVTVPTTAYLLPSVLAGLVAFGAIIGPAYSLAMEREDGTLLRHKAVPHGMRGYVTGQVVYHSLSLLPLLLVLLLPSMLLFDDVMPGAASGWLTVLGFAVLGLLATMPLGIALGSVVPNIQKMGTWGMLPVILTSVVSGVFFPVQALWGWVQVVAQVLPTYWIGVGLRSAFLPDAAAAAELTGAWRTGPAVLVLLAWAVLGALLAPRLLRRVARRQSGSQVQAAREAAGQWVR